MKLKPKLKQLLEDHESAAGRIFDYCILALIILSLASFCIDTIPNLSENAKHWLRVFETITVAIFTIEYLLRLTSSKMHYGKSGRN